MSATHYVITPSSNLRLCYVRAGETHADAGPPVVLVHGFMSSHQTFDGLIGLLAQHRQVYALDLPGYGGSATPSRHGAFDRDFFARAVLDFADALGLERFVLVGHSMGGGVSQAVASLAPDRVEQLVLVNSVGVEVPWSARLAAIPFLGSLVFALFFAVMHLFTRYSLKRPLACARAVAHATLKRTLACLQSARSTLARLKVPTALLWGEADSLLTLTGAYRLADIIPRATVKVIPDAGHFPATDAPQALCHALLETLR